MVPGETAAVSIIQVLLNLKLLVSTVPFTKPWHVTGPHVMAMVLPDCPPYHHYQFLLALLKELQCYSIENVIPGTTFSYIEH